MAKIITVVFVKVHFISVIVFNAIVTLYCSFEKFWKWC